MCLSQNLDNEHIKKKHCVSQPHPFFSIAHGTKKIPYFRIITNQLSTFLMQYIILFYITLSQTYFCSDQNIMYSLFIFTFLQIPRCRNSNIKYKMHNSNKHLLPNTCIWVVRNSETMHGKCRNINFQFTVLQFMGPYNDWGTEISVQIYCLHLQMACEDTQQSPQKHWLPCTRLHGVQTQTTLQFLIALSTSNPVPKNN